MKAKQIYFRILHNILTENQETTIFQDFPPNLYGKSKKPKKPNKNKKRKTKKPKKTKKTIFRDSSKLGHLLEES